MITLNQITKLTHCGKGVTSLTITLKLVIGITNMPTAIGCSIVACDQGVGGGLITGSSTQLSGRQQEVFSGAVNRMKRRGFGHHPIACLEVG